MRVSFLKFTLAAVVLSAVLPAARAEVSARCYLVADATSGHVLAEKDAARKVQVGSLTKIATAIVVLDWAESGHHGLDTLIEIPTAATTVGGINPVGFQAGDQVSLRDLLYAALLQSDSVAANALAAHVGAQVNGEGAPVVAFVAQMNALARSLNMERTRFLNPDGLDSKEQPFSTAADLARLTRHALEKASFRFYVAQKERKIAITRAGQSSEYLLRNTNELLGVNNIDGVKTGQTALAGGCVILTAAREAIVKQQGTTSTVTPRRLLVVVLGSTDRFRDGAGLMAQGVTLYDAWAASGRPAGGAKENL